MEKMPKNGKYQPVKSYSMVYDENNSIVGLLEEKDIINITGFKKDPDIPDKILGYYLTELGGERHVIFSYRGIPHFKPYIRSKKKKEEKENA